MKAIQFSIDFLLVLSLLLLEFGTIYTTSYTLTQPKGNPNLHHIPLEYQPPLQLQHAPAQQTAVHHGSPFSDPFYHEKHTPNHTKDYEKPPPVQQAYPNPNPYQVKYDKNSVPVISLGNNGLATEHGDRAAMYGEFPYKVQIRKNGEFVAGGTLVKSPITGKHVIITATHVIDENKLKFGFVPIKQFEVKMGIIGKESVGQTRQIKAMLPHPDYVKLNTESHRPVYNDITILIPESDFEENQYVKPVDLPSSDNGIGPWAGNYVKVKGWGLGREAGHDGASSTLRVVEVPVWNTERCRQVYWQESGKDIITESHFCAGYEKGGMDTCQGDSGGGATSVDRGRLYLAGVVSWGKGCGIPGYPGVYVKVTKYMEWIKQTLYNYEIRGILPPPLRYIEI